MSDQWYYGQNGVQKGPVSAAEMQQLLGSGKVSRDDLVWREGMANWAPASSIPELLPAAATAPIPPPMNVPPPHNVPPPVGGPIPYPPHPFDPASAALQSKASTAMVLGICSIVFAVCCAPIGLGLGIAAVVMGKNADQALNAGNAKAGFVCGIIGIAMSLVTCLPHSRYIIH